MFVLVREQVHLHSGAGSDKTHVEVIASKRNVRAKLQAPPRNLLAEHGPEHRIDRIVAHLS